MINNSRKTKRIRFYNLRAGDKFPICHQEPIVGSQHIPMQEIEIMRINPKTGYILDESFIHTIHLN